MNDAPLHPVTGEPITPEQLIADSDRLDEIMASGDFAGLVSQVASMRELQRRQRRNTRVLAVVGAIAVAAITLGTYWAFRVDHNTRELDQTKSALRVFCETTNDYNAEAHQAVLDQFSAVADPNQLRMFADVAWPQRDCESLVNPPPTPVTLP